VRDLGFSFSRPDKLLNMNDRLNRWGQAARVKTWRKAAWAAANNARRHPSWPKEVLPFCLVQVDLPVASTMIRRDPHNYYPTVKAIIDGCVDAAVFLDDSQEYLRTEEPRFHNGVDLVTVRIFPVEET
jgi:crossover junction endodeoxyribonuclease RusA